jgi:hypothetical protein
MQQHVRCVTRDIRELLEFLAILRQPVLTADDAAGADVGMAAQALRTGAAEAGQAGDDVVAPDAEGVWALPS